MKLMTITRPSALAAACAQVGVMGRSATTAHAAAVGNWAVRIVPADTRLIQLPTEVAVLAASGYGVQGTSGFNGKGIDTTKQRVDGASGVPPRGRPV